MSSRAVLFAAAFLIAAGASAQVPAGERIPITDPDELQGGSIL